MANSPFKVFGVLAGAAIGVASATYGVQRIVVRTVSRETVDFQFRSREQFVVKVRDGSKIVVYRDGPKNNGKPTIIFLHGYALCSPIWAYQFEILRENYDLIAIDLRGHGASDVGEDGITLGTIANDVYDVIESLELDNVVFVAHSTGGVAAMAYLENYPIHAKEHVAGLCLVSTLAHPPYHHMENISEAFARSTLTGKAFHFFTDVPLIGFPMMRFALGKKASNGIAEFVRRCIISTNKEVCGRYLQILASFNYVDVLEEYQGPSSVIVGTSDPVTPLRDAEIVANALGTTETIMKDVGHCPMLESPDEFNNSLFDFFDQIEEL